MENKLNKDVLIYKTANKAKDNIYDFLKFNTIISFGR